MMTERLQSAIAHAANLLPEAQDRLAAQIESAILNAQWDADIADPQNDAWLQEWIAEAQQDRRLTSPRLRIRFQGKRGEVAREEGVLVGAHRSFQRVFQGDHSLLQGEDRRLGAVGEV